ncbi:MAG: (2Fe-2S)-binding protein [Desulfobacteraceae bacterium]|nr:(2Fe-2S)-binding protein [Desulfobacteraceae bacterium]
MFKPFKPPANGKEVTIDFEGTLLEVSQNITVAAAVLGHAKKNFTRLSNVNSEKRAPCCFMGICHECLMEIDGIPNQQACLIEVREGMKIKRQLGHPGVEK